WIATIRVRAAVGGSSSSATAGQSPRRGSGRCLPRKLDRRATAPRSLARTLGLPAAPHRDNDDPAGFIPAGSRCASVHGFPAASGLSRRGAGLLLPSATCCSSLPPTGAAPHPG